MIDVVDIPSAIQNLDIQISKAGQRFYNWMMHGDDWLAPSWDIESCFLQLLTVAEAIDLPEFRRMALEEYLTVKNSKNGFEDAETDPDGEPYSPVLGRLLCYHHALENLFLLDEGTKVTTELIQIIRDTQYVITDEKVFKSSPANEADVHLRIEAILKCVFPDLKHNPVLSKQIKNFIPDTGISSLQTLIEYKFLSRKTDVATIADQLLADTRGYVSKGWERFLYVIYETKRFRTESDWNRFLRESGVPNSTTIVVLCGESSPNRPSSRTQGKTGKKTTRKTGKKTTRK